MKRINIYFWICTGLLIPAIGIGSVFGIVPGEPAIKLMESLGYPMYLLPLVSVAKLVALVVIFLPKLPRLKEWAYAGVVIDVSGAIYSLLMTGHAITDVIFPIVALMLVFGSYYFHRRRTQTA